MEKSSLDDSRHAAQDTQVKAANLLSQADILREMSSDIFTWRFDHNVCDVSGLRRKQHNGALCASQESCAAPIDPTRGTSLSLGRTHLCIWLATAGSRGKCIQCGNMEMEVGISPA